MKVSEPFVAALGNWTDFLIRHSMHGIFLNSRQHGLSVTQIVAMLLIHRKGVSNVSEMGEALEITSPAASQLLDRLVQQGLLARSEDPNDRRLKQIVLTRRGESVLRDGLHSRQKWLETLAEGMSAEEQECVMKGLQILLQKAEQLECQPPVEV